MTEKRYIVDVDEAIIDTKTNREYTTWDISGVEDICDKLNNLTEENEQLKSYTGEMEDYLARLEEKNEQLKKELRNLRKLANEIYMEKTE